MRKIQILGTGCMKCSQLAKNAELAVHRLGVECAVEKVTDIREIAKFGVLITPGLAIDGVVKSSGRLLSTDEIFALLQESQGQA